MNALKLGLAALFAMAALAAIAAPAAPPAPRSPAVQTGAADKEGRRPVSGRRTMAPDGEVRIHNIAGRVEVVAWDRSEVEVTGTIGGQVERLEFGGGDNYTSINVVLPRSRNCRDECDGIIRVSVPRVARVDVDTTSADISVADAAGAVRAESISGEVVLRTRSRDIYGKSVSGDVEVTGNGADGRIDASSISGEVRIEGVNGSLEVESTSGDVKVERSKLTRLSMVTVSGDLTYIGGLNRGTSYEVQTTSGDARLEVEGPRDATFDLNTFSGDIENAFGPAPRRTSEYAPGQELRFTEGKGAARVRVNTLSGDIDLIGR